jgi:hypothetical protein
MGYQMNVSDWAIICATLLGPVLAVQAQKWIERATERQRRKYWIFETLMATRATRLSAEHVRALNQIELDFSAPSKRDRAVLTAWRQYADILNEQHDEKSVSAWVQRGDDAFITLLHTMAIAVGYSLEKPQIRRGIYYPLALGQTEQRTAVIHDALARVLTGHSAIKMHVESFPQPADEAAAQQSKLQDRLIKAFAADGVLRVEMREPKDSGL